MTTKQLVGALTCLLLAACGMDAKTEAFRQGYPSASGVALKVPESSTTQPLTGTGTRRDGLEGDVATFYVFTRDVTHVVNGGAGAVLDLVERITDYPATTVTDGAAVWGPYTDPLSPNTWRFTVTRLAPNQHHYVLEGKAKTEPDSAFRAVLTGTHSGAGKNVGNGSFTVDWSAQATLPEHDGNVGQASFTYARPSLADATTIDAQFTQVKDSGTSQLFDATYHYTSTPGQGGAFEFQANKDFVGGAAAELLKVRSRWQETGAGRADAKLSGGDLGAGAAATANECWDSNFRSRYLTTSFDPAIAWGSPAACAFSTAEYARE